MDDFSSRPTLPLKILAISARWLLGLLLAAGLVLSAAWAALHFFIVPRISELRPQLESRVSQALGVTVRIGAIVAESDGLFPAIELTDVRLLDREGREALQLPRVLATLSPASLINLGFEQLYIDSPQLDVRRTANGRIYVAGLDLARDPDADSSAGDWFFSQSEFAIRHGTLRWTDEARDAPPLLLHDVDLVVRNTARTHSIRLDVTPPPELGGRLSLRGRFRQPLLSSQAGQWRRWDGQAYAVLDRVDVSQLRRHIPLDVAVDGGAGAMRAWIDVKQGRVSGVTADVALAEVGVKVGPERTPLTFARLSGRLGGRLLDGGFDVFTENLQFDTGDGLHWPGGNVRISQRAAPGTAADRGEFRGDQLDLDALAQLAWRLPLEPRIQEALKTYAPKGLAELVLVKWQGPLQAPQRYEAKGRLSRLEVAAQPGGPAPQDGRDAAVHVGLPGVRGVNLDFDLNQDGGRASVTVVQGHVELPGVFEEPRVPLDQLSAEVHWKRDGEQLAVHLADAHFSNADAQGELQLKWQTGDPATARNHARFPGMLDLQGSLSRADASRVYRYLPQVIKTEVRAYVRDAVTQGRAGGVRFRVKGDLANFPFADPRQGEFRITASVQEGRYAYVPRTVQAPQALPWPALTQLQGDLVVDHASLQLSNISARLEDAPQVQISRGEARIPDLAHAVVETGLTANGPLDDILKRMVSSSPLDSMLGGVLHQATGRGQADVQVTLKLPLRALAQSSVQGQVKLAGNELRFAPQLPALTKARGTVHFSERGFAISAGQASLLGGDVRAEGGTIAIPGRPTAGPALLRVQGTLTAQGLRQADELGALARLAQQATGSTTYAAQFGMRQGVPELRVLSNLQGLALNLPAPLGKKAEAALPLRLETALLTPAGGSEAAAAPARDRLTFDLGHLATLRYERAHTAGETRVLRGAIGIGLAPGESVPMPDQGVVASLNFDNLDLDAWDALLTAPAVSGSSNGPSAGPPPSALVAYLPTSLALRAEALTVGGQKLNRLVAGGSREDQTWRANLDAHELSGYLEYGQPDGAGAGRLYARLARLELAQSEARGVESLLNEQPVSIPAMDVVVDDMVLRGKKLGRVEIEAVNRGAARRDGGAREWRLSRLNIITPEAVLSATGNWAVLEEPVGGTRPAAGRAPAERRRTVLNFKLDIADAGDLLGRFGMPGVIGRGKGRMEGQLAWVGSPMGLDIPTLGGTFTVNVENGQFLKVEPGAAKLLGVLSLQSLPRRLTLDFRDVFSDGFAFDFVRGDVRIEQGLAKTNNLQMKGVNAAVLMEGQADIARETQELKVVVVPEINAGTASLIAGWINPAVGLGSFLAQLVLRRPLIESATQQFQISGSWSDPKITRLDAHSTSEGGGKQ